MGENRELDEIPGSTLFVSFKRDSEKITSILDCFLLDEVSGQMVVETARLNAFPRGKIVV